MAIGRNGRNRRNRPGGVGGGRINRIQNKLDSGNLNKRQTRKLTAKMGRLQDRREQRIPQVAPTINDVTGPQNPTGPIPRPSREGDIASQRNPNPGVSVGDSPMVGQPAPPTDGFNPNTIALPQVRGIEPVDYKGSEMYKFQQAQGEKSLERLMAARGLTNSGAEIEANMKFQQELGGLEAERARSRAQQEADRAQRQADRYVNMNQFDATRGDNNAQNQFHNQLAVTNSMLNQSPMGQAYGAATQGANQAIQHGNTMAGRYGNTYMPYIPGGAPASTPTPSYIPPMALGPDYSGANAYQAYGNASANAGYGQAIGQGVGAFMDYYNS